MARLTNATRDHIIDTEHNEKFHKKLNELEIKLHIEVNKLIKKSLPDWITNEIANSGYMNVGRSFRITDDALNKMVPFDEVDTYYPRLTTKYYHEINSTKTLKSLVEKHNALDKKGRDFCRKLEQTLNVFSTDKQAVDSIPELSKYFDFEKKTQAVIPYEQIKEVREMLKK